MLNKNFRITPLDFSRCNIAWTCPWPTGASWLFINGKHTLGPILMDTAERVVPVPWSASAIIALEIHDFPDISVVPAAIEIPSNTQPTIQWRCVPEAARYRLYHRGYAEANETLLLELPARAGLDNYQITCPSPLAAGWHFFHVEAMDAYGNESLRQAWNYFVWDLPKTTPSLVVTAGSISKTYTFTLEN
ncbi:MAG: hypothetical protein FWD61_01095 [Phycisphaerales bacterium]|nr:hypothetical protein [Phycisphaerales bacterium]